MSKFETWATESPEYRQFRTIDEDRIRAALEGSLDAAWAEAEAALPEGWCDLMVYHFDPAPGDVHLEGSYGAKTADPNWLAPDGRETYGYGTTPVAALRALAATLKELR